MPQSTLAHHPFHPLATRARVLLSSVFGPYGQDDQYGSRKINPMELYQNQVTRLQGGFSLRMFHRSFGLMMIQANIDAPCTLLDFPTLERFTEEKSRRVKSRRVQGASIFGFPYPGALHGRDPPTELRRHRHQRDYCQCRQNSKDV